MIDPNGHVQLPDVWRTEPKYLGDGVYASWDAPNQQIWLSVNDHEAPPVVALNSQVLNNLFNYAKRMKMEAE